MTAMQGSLFWMAPELFANHKKGYSAKIDIWSLGCVFLEMFVGRRPWENDDFVSVMFKVGGTVPSPDALYLTRTRLQVVHSKMAPPVPDDVVLSSEADHFRLQCFEQDPDERPTASALRRHRWLVLEPGWTFPGFR